MGRRGVFAQPGLPQDVAHPRVRRFRRAAVGQLLDAVGKSLHQEAPMIGGRLAAEERAPPRL